MLQLKSVVNAQWHASLYSFNADYLTLLLLTHFQATDIITIIIILSNMYTMVQTEKNTDTTQMQWYFEILANKHQEENLYF